MVSLYRYLYLCFCLFTCRLLQFNAEHPWIKEGGNASDKPIDNAVLSRMKQFRAMNKLKKLALKVNCCMEFLANTVGSMSRENRLDCENL